MFGRKNGNGVPEEKFFLFAINERGAYLPYGTSGGEPCWNVAHPEPLTFDQAKKIARMAMADSAFYGFKISPDRRRVS